MKILMADDTEMHRTMFLQNIQKVPGVEINVLGQAVDGSNLVELYKKFSAQGPIDVVFTDIRMPNMDGLSALVKIKALNPSQLIVMVSSEDLAKMEMINVSKGDNDKASVDLAKKLDLLNKVAERLKAGTIEPGKINSILEGCEKLAADPMQVAKHFGARGYLRKPYNSQKMSELLAAIKTSPFAQVI